jgi:hypothetical protein
MAMGFRARLWAAARQREEAVGAADFGLGQSEPVTEAALRRVGGYRCSRPGTYCTRRIDAGRGLARAGSWDRSSAERWGRLALDCAWPRLDTEMTNRAITRAELEVRRVYKPNRLAAMYVSAAYAQVVPSRQRPARSTGSSGSASVSRLVTVGPEMTDVGARRAG